MKKFTFLVLLSVAIINCFSQSVSINIDGSKADTSAILDVKSTNKGFLPPRIFLNNRQDVTTIIKPAVGLLVYNTNGNINGAGCCSGIYMYNGSAWARLKNDADTVVTATYAPLGNHVSTNSGQVFQTFTATQTGTLAAVAITTTGDYGALGSRPIKFFSGAGDKGQLLTTMTLPGNNGSGNSIEIATPPAIQINLIAGQTYTIETSGYGWAYVPGGDFSIYTGGYSSDANSADSYGFRIFVAR